MQFNYALKEWFIKKFPELFRFRLLQFGDCALNSAPELYETTQMTNKKRTSSTTPDEQ